MDMLDNVNAPAGNGTQSRVATMADLAGYGTPVGVVQPYLGTTAPEKYVLCNGAAISRTEYAELFAIIGTRYGGGNGSTTFNVPDFQGLLLRGAGGDAAAMGTTQDWAIKDITGTLGIVAWVQNPGPSGAFSGTATSNIPVGGTNAGRGNITFSAQNSPGYGASHIADEVRPINQSVNYIIKAKA